MSDLASWIAAVVGVAALVVAYLAYRSQRGRTRLEYVVETNAHLLPQAVADHVQVLRDGQVIDNPAISIIRLVNTGDRSIQIADFHSDLKFKFADSVNIVALTLTKSRPSEWKPDISYTKNEISIKPTLINPDDMLQIQALTSGGAGKITVGSRISNITEIKRRELPYPPGSGREGELLPFDKFMWYGVMPAAIILFGVVMPQGIGLSVTARVILAVVAIVAAGILHPMWVRHLIRRRRLWRP